MNAETVYINAITQGELQRQQVGWWRSPEEYLYLSTPSNVQTKGKPRKGMEKEQRKIMHSKYKTVKGGMYTQSAQVE